MRLRIPKRSDPVGVVAAELLGWSSLPEGNELPFSFRFKGRMPEKVDVAVICANLEEDVFWTVPLVDYFFHEIIPLIELKANWP